MSRDNKEKSFPERLKKFLKGDKKASTNEREIQLSDDHKFELGPQSPTGTRIKAIKDLQEVLNSRKMNEVEIRKLWQQVRDMVSLQQPAPERHLVLQLLSGVAVSTDQLGLTREYFFNHIVQVFEEEDIKVIFKFFCAITNDGKQIRNIEHRIGPFLVQSLSSLLNGISPSTPVIIMVTNLIKFNSAYLDEESVYCLVKILILYNVKSFEETNAILQFKDSLIAYCYIPKRTLLIFIASLARLISIPRLVEPAWKVMRNLLKTHLGNTAIFAICEIVETAKDSHHVRGCIYFLSNALWTKSRITSIKINPIGILPTLQVASEHRHQLVVYETAIAIQKLVCNRSSELHLVTWDMVLNILSKLFFYAANYENKENAQMIYNVLHGTLDEIDQMVDSVHMWKVSAKYFDLVDCYSEQRKVASILKLLEYKFKVLRPNESKWIARLKSLIHKHFREDPRSIIRIHALHELRTFFDNYLYSYGESICRNVLLLQLDELETDPDISVRKAGVSLLVHAVLSLNVPENEQLLFFIEKVVLAMYKKHTGIDAVELKEEDVEDIAEGIDGLITIFKKKIWVLPSSCAIQAYQILMAFLELHYKKPKIMASVSSIRTKVFKMIFEMRADSSYHLGLPNCPEALIPYSPEEAPAFLKKYTPYIVVDHKFGLKPTAGYSVFKKFSIGSPEAQDSSFSSDDMTHKNKEVEDDLDYLQMDDEHLDGRSYQETRISSPESVGPEQSGGFGSTKESPVHDSDLEKAVEESRLTKNQFDFKPTIEVAHLSLTKAAWLVILAMKNERDWPLLKLILDKIPEVLQNKALILSKDGNDIDYLAGNLCSLVSDENLLTSQFSNFPTKFRRTEFNSCVYPVMANLACYHQDLSMVRQKNVIQCLQNGMQSNASALCIRAITLCTLEMRITMSKMLRSVMLTISKMSATLTNAQPSLEFLSTLLNLPSIYSDFSPDQYRSVFAIAIPYTNPFKFNHYIVLLAYQVIAMWFLKCRLPYRKNFVNYISKSLHLILEQEGSNNKFKTPMNEQQSKGDMDMNQFYKDLRETCVDFMSRYCFDSYSPLCRRRCIADFLVNSGQTQMWILGTRLITITTSGCSQRPIKNGLCDKCVQLCTQGTDEPEEKSSSSDFVYNRRRHKSDYHHTVTNEAKYQPQSKDDLHMKSKRHDDDLMSGFLETEKTSSSAVGTETNASFCSPDDCFSSDLKMRSGERKESHFCACWCKGWAEIHIRQPTGNVSWMMRIQNPKSVSPASDFLPIDDLSSLYSPFGEGGIPENWEKENGLHFLSSDADGVGLGTTEWSNSGSIASSGAASLASSDLKLHQTAELQDPDKDRASAHNPVSYCYSNPEISAKTYNESVFLSSLTGENRSTEQGLGATKVKTRTASGTVRRSNSIVGPPSPPLPTGSMNRIRHFSAMQMKTSQSSTVTADEEAAVDPSLQPFKRGRGHTISDMTPASRKANNFRGSKILNRRPTLGYTGSLANSASGSTESSSSLFSEASSSMTATATATSTSSASGGRHTLRETKGGVSPSAVFLQLFYQGTLAGGWMRPILLPIRNTDVERSIKLLDLIKPQENHKIGVVYAGPNQTTEAEILKNSSGSIRYLNFLEGLGTVYNFSELPDDTFLGGLDSRGVDGSCVYMWQDDIMQIVFHVATIMPNKESDHNCTDKKRHIGNNYVTIVYNDSGVPYELDRIKSQFNHAMVEIVPGDHNINCINLLCQPDVGEFINWKISEPPRLVSDINLPVLARQIALLANLASTICTSQKRVSYSPYWLQRLRKIRLIREKALGTPEYDKQYQEQQTQLFGASSDTDSENQFLDFSDMIDTDKPDVKSKHTSAEFLNRR